MNINCLDIYLPVFQLIILISKNNNINKLQTFLYMSFPLSILIIDKNASLRCLSVKDFKESELYKKCGFKVAEYFMMQTKWRVNVNDTKYNVFLYGKSEGKANMENKYEFPPPVDNTLFFGSCAIVCSNENNEYINMSIELWNKIYEKLFGGFHDLSTNEQEDDDESDELDSVPRNMVTKSGYLKDGFVVDSGDTEQEEHYDDTSELSEESYI
jgi:hypothetical protein